MLTRRELLKYASLLPVVSLLPAACSEASAGPVPVSWGRDTCEHCGMIISDKRFAAQIRGGAGNKAHKAHKFDDVGCAVMWIERGNLKGAEPSEFWAMSHEDSATWLDARHSFFKHGLGSPMNYGFAAFREQGPGMVTYDRMREAVVLYDKAHTCATQIENG